MRTQACLWLLLTAACGGGAEPAYLVYVRNSQGSVVAAVDDSGRKVWETHDDAYGLRLSSSGAPIPREFLDQPFDEETGFFHFEDRIYDPTTAQWLSPDPALVADPGRCSQDPQLCNPYAFAGDRPEEWTDPDGRWIANDVKIGNQLYTVMTLAFYGPDATKAALAAQQGLDALNATHGPRQIAYDIRTYEDTKDIPPSFTRVRADFKSTENDSRSQYDSATSTIDLNSDAKDPTLRSGIVVHELGHGAGAGEGYDDVPIGAGETNSVSRPGREHDIMGADLDLKPLQITQIDVAQWTAAQNQGEINQGLTPPTPEEWQFPTDLPTAAP